MSGPSGVPLFLAEPPAAAAPLPVVKQLRARTPWWMAAGCAAAGAVLAVFVAAPEAPGVRSKGGESVSFYVKRGDDVHRGQPRERLQRGDKLRFTYTTGSERYLAILSLDGAHRASVYYPAATDAETARVAPGVEVALPSAVELDDVSGEEQIIALFCDRALALAPLRAELESKRLAMPTPQGCTLHRLSVVKQAP